MMDEPEELPPLQYASVIAEGDGWRVVIRHPDYRGGADIEITGYANEDGANEGARWWETRLTESPPAELIDMRDGSAHARFGGN